MYLQFFVCSKSDGDIFKISAVFGNHLRTTQSQQLTWGYSGGQGLSSQGDHGGTRPQDIHTCNSKQKM